jgi:hypothetical protein
MLLEVATCRFASTFHLNNTSHPFPKLPLNSSSRKYGRLTRFFRSSRRHHWHHRQTRRQCRQCSLASSKPYRLVGLTRDASKPASKEWERKGIEMKEVTIAVGNEDQLRAAFKGADIVFVSVSLHIGVPSLLILSRSRQQTSGHTLIKNMRLRKGSWVSPLVPFAAESC